MIGSIAFVLLGAAAAATPCENLATLKLSDATITSAVVVPEGPPPARGGGGGGGGAEVAREVAELVEQCGGGECLRLHGASANRRSRSRCTGRSTGCRRARWRSSRQRCAGCTSGEYPGSLPRSAGSEAFFRLPY